MADELHIQPSASPPAEISGEGYLGYFHTEGGDIVFHQPQGEPAATIWHSDADWRPYTFTDPARTGMVLGAEERIWLKLCWEASRVFRSAPSLF
jgi:hypothetical protein